MTYRDELNKKSSYELYHIVASFRLNGGDLAEADKELFITVSWDVDNESYKEALVDLIERLHNDDLL